MSTFLNYPFYIIFGTLPSLIWLNYYLRKDVHPEPKLLILRTFFYGILVCLPAIFLEIGFSEVLSKINLPQSLSFLLNVFLGVALVEELLKFFVVKITVLNHPEFEEAVDAMIYMVVAALGFAAGENILFLFPLKPPFWTEILGISLIRFLGATFLHTLASAIVGFFIALALFTTQKKEKLIILGLILAILLHGFYNFFIMEIEGGGKLLMPLILLLTSGLFVSCGFANLKKVKYNKISSLS